MSDLFSDLSSSNLLSLGSFIVTVIFGFIAIRARNIANEALRQANYPIINLRMEQEEVHVLGKPTLIVYNDGKHKALDVTITMKLGDKIIVTSYERSFDENSRIIFQPFTMLESLTYIFPMPREYTWFERTYNFAELIYEQTPEKLDRTEDYQYIPKDNLVVSVNYEVNYKPPIYGFKKHIKEHLQVKFMPEGNPIEKWIRIN